MGKRTFLGKYRGEEIVSCLEGSCGLCYWNGSSEQETIEDRGRSDRELFWVTVSSRLSMTGGTQRFLGLTDSQNHSPPGEQTIDEQLAGLGCFGRVAFLSCPYCE